MIYNKTKKFFSTLLLITFMVNMLPSVLVFADGPSGKCGENVTYSFNESIGELTISGNGEMENYESSEGTPWYDFRDSIKSVIIENGVISIGANSFACCINLTSATIYSSVINIGSMAFWDCSDLTLVSFLGNEVEPSFGNDVFDGCSRLNKIKVPYEYRGSSFCGKEIERPYKSFNDGSPFCTFGEPEDVNENPLARATHATYSFDESTGVLTISGKGPMPKCEKRNMARWCDRRNYSDDCNMYLRPWEPLRGGNVQNYDIKSVVIEEGVTSISTKIFHGCSDLTSVTIPDSVTSIGSDAFAGCYRLSSVTIGNGLTTIDSGAFDKCSSLTSIDIPNSVTTIGAYAFAECGLTSITIPKSVTTIDRQAFNRCYNLLSVGFLGSVEPSTGKNVFNKCSKLKKIIVPDEYTNSSFCGKSVQRLSESGSSGCSIA